MSRQALLGLVVVVVACSPGPAEEESNAPQAVIVDTAPVESLLVEPSLEALGSVEAGERVGVSPEIPGIVEAVDFEEGQLITPGKRPVLFRLDDDLLELQTQAAAAHLAVVEADLAQRQAAFKRQEMMYHERATTEAAYTDTRLALQQARAVREQAQANLNLAHKRLEQATIRAPISGLLGETSISPGDYVRPGQSLVEIVSIDPIDVSFSIPERFRAQLRTDLKVAITTEAYGDRQFEGQVFFVAPDIDPTTRTVRLKAHFSNADLTLRPGLFARVHLVLGQAVESRVVPEAAIVPRGDRFYVYTVDSGTASRRQVTLGQRLPGKVAIVEGFEGLSTVIVGGLQRVSDGFAVEIRRPAVSGD